MESLVQIEKNIDAAIARYNQLLQEIENLRNYNVKLQQELFEAKTLIAQLENDNKKMRFVSGMYGSEEERKKTKQHLTALITRCEKALELLKTK